MAAKKGKKASKKKAPKRKAAKRKAKRKTAPAAAAPKAAAPKKRKKAKRKAPAAAAAAPKPPRKAPKKPRKKPSAGGSGPGQFASGKPNATITVRRSDDGMFTNLRTETHRQGEGEVDHIKVHRNPTDAGLFILTGATAGAAGFGLASLAGRVYVTSKFALSREKDANGVALFAVDKTTGKITHADGSPVTGTDYAAQVNAFSWMRELISFGVAGVSILGGMYLLEPGGIPRTIAVWTGVGSAVEGGVSFFGKLALPWMLRKNQTFATRLAPSEVNTYLLQHPDALKDQPSGDAWTVSGAPLGSAPAGGSALGGGCAGGEECGCGSCCAKRSQALQNCIQKYNGQPAPQAPPRSVTPTAPTSPRPVTEIATPMAPQPTQVMNRPVGGVDNVRPIMSTRDQARARNSA